MNKETFKYIINDFQERGLPDIKPRELILPVGTQKIVTLAGIRRCGKTYLLFDTMKRLLEQGVERSNIIYVNFEDDRLFPLQLSDMDLILRAYYEYYPEKTTEKKYLFFDEIQNVINWEKYIRRIDDTENVQIFITGSSSQMVSEAIASSLRGRSISYEVFPLSFQEFLRFRNIEVRPYSTQSEMQVRNALTEYIHIGGFPEVVDAESPVREKIWKEYVDLLLYKDLVEYYGIGNQFLLKALMKFCLSHPGSLLSINKLYHDFKSQGIELSKNTLYEYLEAMQNAFLLFRIPKYDRSLRIQSQNPKKIYSIDTGMLNTFIPDPMVDTGKKIENIIYLNLRRQEKELYYYKNKHEIDFLVRSKNKMQLINVCQTLHESSTFQREVNGLQMGLDRFPNSEALLIADELPNRKIPEPIRAIPLWKYLLEDGCE